MTETVVLPPRFRGPPTSANGGFTAGTVARAIDRVAEVTLRRPSPLETPLTLTRTADGAELHDGEVLVADAVAVEFDLDVPRRDLRTLIPRIDERRRAR